MAVSRNSGYRSRAGFWRRLFGQLSRYDLVLAAVPLLFAVPLALHAALAVPFYPAVGASAGVSAALVVDALFLNPPIDTA